LDVVFGEDDAQTLIKNAEEFLKKAQEFIEKSFKFKPSPSS
jgi:hypothetical protein